MSSLLVAWALVCFHDGCVFGQWRRHCWREDTLYVCTGSVTAWGLADGKSEGATIGGRTEAKCQCRQERGGSWLTAYLWASPLGEGWRPHVHCVSVSCVLVSSLAVYLSFARH